MYAVKPAPKGQSKVSHFIEVPDQIVVKGLYECWLYL